MIGRVALRHRHGLLSSTFCLSKASATSPPTQRIPSSSLPRSPPFQHQSRAAHTIPSLGPQNDEILKNGFEGLMSPEALNEIWTIYMRHLLARLNDLLAQGTEQGDQNKNLKQLLIMYARNPAKANLFNYASMAHNHHFFLSTLSTRPHVAMPQQLEQDLSRSFSSIHTLRETFIDVANAMFGPGYVWLVLQWNPSPHHSNTANKGPESSDLRMAAGNSTSSQQNDESLKFDFRILPTYIAGSPYPGAHSRQQARNMTNYNVEEVREAQSRNQIAKGVGAFSTDGSRRKDNYMDGDPNSIKRWSGADIMPLMCVSTWQHAYMQDWGIDGKKMFLEAWWDRIDWEKVWANAGLASQNHRSA